MVSCCTAFSANVESYDASLQSLYELSARTPLPAPAHVVDANPPIVMLKVKSLSQYSRRYLASAPVQAPDAPRVMTSHPPVGFRSSKDTLAPPVEGLMPPFSAEAAPAQSRLPKPTLAPEVSRKRLAQLRLLFIIYL